MTESPIAIKFDGIYGARSNRVQDKSADSLTQLASSKVNDQSFYLRTVFVRDSVAPLCSRRMSTVLRSQAGTGSPPIRFMR